MEIAERLDVSYDTCEIDLEDEEAVVQWICKRQLARRNLTHLEFKDLIGRAYKSCQETPPPIM